MYSSTELIEASQKRYNELKHKDYEERSFKTGFIEGMVQAMQKPGSQEWVSVFDRLPEEDHYYMVSGSFYPVVAVRPFNVHHQCWDDEEGDDYFCDAIGDKITHWMPLPQPPHQEQKGGG